jgi:hypothetical protein
MFDLVLSSADKATFVFSFYLFVIVRMHQLRTPYMQKLGPSSPGALRDKPKSAPALALLAKKANNPRNDR